MAEHVCPVWAGYFLLNPFRKLGQNPKRILAPYINKGIKTLDFGCAMGFFSLPMARMVGSQGKVICVDVQEKMIKKLNKRANKAGLLDRIETRFCNQSSFGLENLKEQIDFALAFAVAHEVPDVNKLFSAIYETLKPGGKLLMAEPKGHVSEQDFSTTISVAEQTGFKVIYSPKIRQSRAVLLGKK